MRACFALLLLFVPQTALAAPRVVAAEAVYADITRQIAGPGSDVTGILTNPAQDPHLFEASPSVARALSGAAIVIYNGAGYDPWMRGLLSATAGAGVRRVIDVADLLHAGQGGNPHLWYDPRVMPALARVIARALSDADPAGAAGYAQRLAVLNASLDRLAARIAAMRARNAGAAVTATEPVFGLMVDALGLQDRDASFQRAVMNDTEPSAADIATMERNLRSHAVRLLLRNSQTDDDLARRMVEVADRAHVPVVAVSETEPPGTTYQLWVGGELDRVQRALGSTP